MRSHLANPYFCTTVEMLYVYQHELSHSKVQEFNPSMEHLKPNHDIPTDRESSNEFTNGKAARLQVNWCLMISGMSNMEMN